MVLCKSHLVKPCLNVLGLYTIYHVKLRRIMMAAAAYTLHVSGKALKWGREEEKDSVKIYFDELTTL